MPLHVCNAADGKVKTHCNTNSPEKSELRRIDLAKAPPRLPQTSGEKLFSRLSESKLAWMQRPVARQRT